MTKQYGLAAFLFLFLFIGRSAVAKDVASVVEVKGAAIDYFKPGSAKSFFIWDAATTSFKRIWISD